MSQPLGDKFGNLLAAAAAANDLQDNARAQPSLLLPQQSRTALGGASNYSPGIASILASHQSRSAVAKSTAAGGGGDAEYSITLNPDVTGTRPVTEEEFGLDVRFHESSNWKLWSFNEKNDKLYAARDRIVSAWIRMSDDLNPKDKENVAVATDDVYYYVKLVLLYSSNQHSVKPVLKCPQHKSGGGTAAGTAGIKGSTEKSPVSNAALDLSNASSAESSIHFSIALPATQDDCVVVSHNHTEAKLLQDPSSGRFFVLLPFQKKQLAEGCNLDFSFGCNNTCQGLEYSARQWNVMIVVENSRGKVVGRRLVKVKVCAAPKRERAIEEGQFKRPQHLEGINKRLSGTGGLPENGGLLPLPKTLRLDNSPGQDGLVDTGAANHSGGLSVSVRDQRECELLTRIRDELRTSPSLKAFIEHRIYFD